VIDGEQKWFNFQETLFTSGCDLLPNSLLKDIWHWEKFNIIKLVFSMLQCTRIYIYIYGQRELDAQEKKGSFHQ
jgi:hypothetical protein